MKTLTGIAVVPSAEGKRIAYTYSELSGQGEVLSAGNKGNFIAMGGEELAAIETLENAARARLGGD